MSPAIHVLFHSCLSRQNTNNLWKNTDAKKISLTVLFERSKAFASICHDLLFSRLCNVGMSVCGRAWMGATCLNAVRSSREDKLYLFHSFPSAVGDTMELICKINTILYNECYLFNKKLCMP